MVGIESQLVDARSLSAHTASSRGRLTRRSARQRDTQARARQSEAHDSERCGAVVTTNTVQLQQWIRASSIAARCASRPPRGDARRRTTKGAFAAELRHPSRQRACPLLRPSPMDTASTERRCRKQENFDGRSQFSKRTQANSSGPLPRSEVILCSDGQSNSPFTSRQTQKWQRTPTRMTALGTAGRPERRMYSNRVHSHVHCACKIGRPSSDGKKGMCPRVLQALSLPGLGALAFVAVPNARLHLTFSSTARSQP